MKFSKICIRFTHCMQQNIAEIKQNRQNGEVHYFHCLEASNIINMSTLQLKLNGESPISEQLIFNPNTKSIQRRKESLSNNWHLHKCIFFKGKTMNPTSIPLLM